MQEFEIVFYRKENGDEPVKDFLLSLNVKIRAKVMRSLSLLAKNGFELREPFSKYLGDEIFELRVNFSSDASRILYFFVTERKIVLTNGFIKKTQKTPQAEIEKAKRYKDDYMNRRNKNKNGN